MTIPLPTAGLYNRGDLKTMERVFTDLSGYSLLRNILSPVVVFDPSTDTRSWGFGFCVYVFCVLFGFGLFPPPQVPNPVLLIFFSVLMRLRLELRKPALHKCISSPVALSELNHGTFFPAKHVFNIKCIQNGKLPWKVFRMFLVIIS